MKQKLTKEQADALLSYIEQSASPWDNPAIAMAHIKQAIIQNTEKLALRSFHIDETEMRYRKDVEVTSENIWISQNGSYFAFDKTQVEQLKDILTEILDNWDSYQE